MGLRPGTAEFQLKPKGFRDRHPNPSSEAGADPLTQSSCSSRVSGDGMSPAPDTHTGRATCLTQCTDRNVTCAQHTLTDTARIMCDQKSEHPVAQSSWHIKLVTTAYLNLICPFFPDSQAGVGKEFKTWGRVPGRGKPTPPWATSFWLFP